MAATFKSITATSMSGATTVYTGPASTQTVVIGFQVSNKHTAAITITATSAGSTLCKDIKIPVGSSFSPIIGKLVVEATEKIIVTPSINSVSDTTLSILEIV